MRREFRARPHRRACHAPYARMMHAPLVSVTALRRIATHCVARIGVAFSKIAADWKSERDQARRRKPGEAREKETEIDK